MIAQATKTAIAVLVVGKFETKAQILAMRPHVVTPKS